MTDAPVLGGAWQMQLLPVLRATPARLYNSASAY
jgi:hypothetical protein